LTAPAPQVDSAARGGAVQVPDTAAEARAATAGRLAWLWAPVGEGEGGGEGEGINGSKGEGGAEEAEWGVTGADRSTRERSHFWRAPSPRAPRAPYRDEEDAPAPLEASPRSAERGAPLLLKDASFRSRGPPPDGAEGERQAERPGGGGAGGAGGADGGLNGLLGWWEESLGWVTSQVDELRADLGDQRNRPEAAPA